MVEITIRVPDELGKRLERVQSRLPELLERALADDVVDRGTIPADEREIIEMLTSGPAPQAVLAMKPSERLQTRVSELLERSKQDGLTQAEEFEMERYLTLEHWVRLAKAHAYEQLSNAS